MLVLTAVIAVGTLLGGWSTYVGLKDGSRSADSTGAIGSSIPTTPPARGDEAGSGRTSTTPAGKPVRAEGTVLGVDLRPVASETCRKPTSATGSGWEVHVVKLGGSMYEAGFTCNLFSRATGSLDFDLGGRFSTLELTAGFADDSTGIQHRVRFEVIGDGRFQLEDRTIGFGEVLNMKIDVSGISRLRLKITETVAPSVDDSPSRPVWANAALR